jgi:hypothetical protein
MLLSIVFIVYTLVVLASAHFTNHVRAITSTATIVCSVVIATIFKSDIQNKKLTFFEKYKDTPLVQEECPDMKNEEDSVGEISSTNVYDETNYKQVILSVPDAMDAQGYTYEGISGFALS